MQHFNGDAFGAWQEIDTGTRLHAHNGAKQAQVMIATDQVNAVTLRAAIHDGPHHATRLRAFGEEISNQNDARAGKPTIDQEQQLLKLCPTSMNITNGNRGGLGPCRGASCTGIAARPRRFHGGSVTWKVLQVQ